MKRHLIALFLGYYLLSVICQGQVIKRWDFNHSGDQEGWSIPVDERGVVMGGALWLTLAHKETDPAKIASTRYQWKIDEDNRYLITSPAQLEIPAAKVSQVRLRVLNLSSLTDFVLKWRTKENAWGDKTSGSEHFRRIALKSDVKEWQEIICYVDQNWEGTIEQIAIGRSLQEKLRGDLWIDWIELTKSAPEPVRERPDVASAHVVPNVTIPGISQAGFQSAFKALDQCLTVNVPIYGFNYPVMSPGGYYTSSGWFQLDSSLAVTGAQWANQSFAEDVMRGFRELQACNPDGRIDPTGSFWTRGQVGDSSSLPKLLEVAYDVARRTNDVKLRGQIYELMRQYLEWWLSPTKKDVRTGLISGIVEETFGDISQSPPGDLWLPNMTLAPVDLNVEVAIGAANTSKLAAALGKRDEAKHYLQVSKELAQAINSYLWDEVTGTYCNYDLVEGRRIAGLNVTIFDPLRLRIAPEERQDRLLQRLLDPTQFNWGKRPLTSWAMAESRYVEAKGTYDGRAWFGNIWTLRNMVVVDGLEESGRPDLAAELNWSTIKTFHNNYWEYALPSTGEGQGATSYAWTASQYIGAIIEHLFGIDCDAIERRVRITPHVPKELYGQEIALDDLILPTGGNTRLAVRIKQTSPTAAKIEVKISGKLPDGELLVALPGTAQERRAPMESSLEVNFQ